MSRVHAGWLAVVATLGAAVPAAGQQAESPAATTNDQWAVTVAPYLWAAALDGNATVAGIKADVDVPFEDTLKDLSGGAMLVVDVRKDRFGVAVNGLYARVSPDSDAGGVKIDATSDTVQIAVAPYYRVVDLAVWRLVLGPALAPLRGAGGRLSFQLSAHRARGAGRADGR